MEIQWEWTSYHPHTSSINTWISGVMNNLGDLVWSEWSNYYKQSFSEGQTKSVRNKPTPRLYRQRYCRVQTVSKQTNYEFRWKWMCCLQDRITDVQVHILTEVTVTCLIYLPLRSEVWSTFALGHPPLLFLTRRRSPSFFDTISAPSSVRDFPASRPLTSE